MEMPADAGREYWRKVLAAGGSTVIPRWTLDPEPGVGEYTAALRGPVGGPGALLAAHAVVLAALSGERDVVTGYVAGGRVLPCRLTTEPGPWRAVLDETARVEAELLRHADVAVEDVRRELGVAGPSFTTMVDPA